MFHVEQSELMMFWTEPGFSASVAAEMGPIIKNIPDVKHAVLVNALDRNREDQAVWMKRFEGMTGKKFLWDEGDV